MRPYNGINKAVRKSGFFITGLLVFAMGCAPRQVNDAEVSVEYQSPQEAAIDAVRQASADFLVGHGDEAYANERLIFFFKNVLSVQPKRSNSNSVSGELLISGGSENFVYTVRKSPDKAGVYYQVRCVPRSSNTDPNEKADLNARNLARFISKGSLENRVVSK